MVGEPVEESRVLGTVLELQEAAVHHPAHGLLVEHDVVDEVVELRRARAVRLDALGRAKQVERRRQPVVDLAPELLARLGVEPPVPVAQDGEGHALLRALVDPALQERHLLQQLLAVVARRRQRYVEAARLQMHRQEPDRLPGDRDRDVDAAPHAAVQGERREVAVVGGRQAGPDREARPLRVVRSSTKSWYLPAANTRRAAVSFSISWSAITSAPSASAYPASRA